MWTLPGGGLAFAEAPPKAVLRELEEETGLIGAVRSLAEVRDESARWVHPDDGVDEAVHSVQVMYRVDVTAGELRAEVDGSTDSAAWFTRDEAVALPLVDLARAGVRLAFDEG